MGKDSFFYTIGEFLSKAIPFLLLPILTRMLGVEGFGYYSEQLAYVNLMMVFILLSQDGALLRYYYKYGKFGTIIISSVAPYISAVLLLCFSFLSFLLDNEFLMVAAVIALSQSVLAIQLSRRQCRKMAKDYFVLQLVNTISILLFTIILLRGFDTDYRLCFLGIFLGNITAIIYAKRTTPLGYGANATTQRRKMFVGYLLCFGFPLIFHNLSFFAKGYFDRLIIGDMFGYEELSIYSAAFQIAAALSVLIVALNKALVPYYLEAIKMKSIGRSEVINYSLFSLLIAPILFLIAFVVPEPLYVFVLGGGFDDISEYISKFVFGISLSVPYLLVVNYCFYYGKNRSIAICTFSSALLHVGLLYYISPFGIAYLPYALIISNLLSYILLCVVVWRVKH